MVVITDIEGFQYKDSPLIIKELCIYDPVSSYLWHTMLPPPNMKLTRETRRHFLQLTSLTHGLHYQYNPYNLKRYHQKLRDAADLIRKLAPDAIFAEGLDKAIRLSQLLNLEIGNLENILPNNSSLRKDYVLPCIPCPYNHIIPINCATVRCQHFGKNFHSLCISLKILSLQ